MRLWTHELWTHDAAGDMQLYTSFAAVYFPLFYFMHPARIEDSPHIVCRLPWIKLVRTAEFSNSLDAQGVRLLPMWHARLARRGHYIDSPVTTTANQALGQSREREKSAICP